MAKIPCLVICMFVFWIGNILGQGISDVQIARVLPANALAGIVTLGGSDEGVPGVLVEECTPNWVKPVARTRTDDTGNFNLPILNRRPIYYLRISMKGANTLMVKVKIDPKAGGLVLNLQLST